MTETEGLVSQPGSNEWWIVRRVANGDARRPWYQLSREDIAALTPAKPPQGDNRIGAAELAVGQFVYRRVEKLMDAQGNTPEGRELDYLAELVGNVEEYGATGDEDGAQWFSRHWSAPPPPDREGQPVKMLVDQDWLERKVAADPDDADSEARPGIDLQEQLAEREAQDVPRDEQGRDAHQIIAECNRRAMLRRAGVPDRSREPLLGLEDDMAVSRILLAERPDFDPKEADRLAVLIANALRPRAEAAEAQRDLLQGQVERLMEAGKPFARIGDLLDKYAAYKGRITLGENPWAEHFRALRAAHATITGEKGP